MTTNDELLHQEFSKGMLFMDFFEILAFQSGEFKSHSEMLLWGLRQNPGLNHLKSGHAQIREFRAWGSKEIETSEESTIEVGAWTGLRNLLTDLQSAEQNQDIVCYLSFCIDLCDIEKAIISNARSNNEDQMLRDIIKQWFCLDTIKHPAFNVNECLDIHRLMLWAALFELYIAIAYPDKQTATTHNGNPTSLKHYLPRIGEKGELITSTEALFDYLLKKRGYASKQKLYEDITYSENPSIEESKEIKDPKSIRTQFERWMKGKSPFTIKSFKKVFRFLLNIKPDEYDESLLYILLVNVFSKKQRQLQDAGHSSEDIAEEFSKYPIYLDRAYDNWQRFRSRKTDNH